MIDAYEAGIPGNGKPVPNGAKMAKVHWIPKPNEFFPTVMVPGNLLNVDFMVEDSQRFADSGGWGYAVFDYNPATDTFTPGTTAGSPPQSDDAKCGFACHTRAKTRDYVYGVRKAVNRRVENEWSSHAATGVAEADVYGGRSVTSVADDGHYELSRAIDSSRPNDLEARETQGGVAKAPPARSLRSPFRGADGSAVHELT
jgi:Cytochrome P460